MAFDQRSSLLSKAYQKAHGMINLSYPPAHWCFACLILIINAENTSIALVLLKQG